MADNGSPSPLPINPNLRGSDNVRRSFSSKPSSLLTNSRRFDPTTPANSPSELPRRHSVDLYPKEKENCEKDQTSSKPSKFQKNFMAPTISAASKFSPSPKRKVLVERNDPVRTSISLSEGKALFFSSNDPKPETDCHKTETSLDSNDSDLEKKQQPLKRVTFSQVDSLIDESLPESVITESDSSKLEVGAINEIGSSVDSSSIAPLDADPSMPPYDPKTNYLSPRPQFLHYKPNPRVEILLNKDKGLQADELTQLEDSLMAEILSESFTDSEGTEDSENEEPQNGASADVVIGVDEEIEDISHPFESSESLPEEMAFGEVAFEETVAKEKEKGPWLILRKLFWFSMIMMFVIGCGFGFVWLSPAFEELSLKDVRFSDVSVSAKLKFDKLAMQVNEFVVKSAVSISELSSELRRGERIGSLRFMNLSDVQRMDEWNVDEAEEEVLEEAKDDAFTEEILEEVFEAHDDDDDDDDDNGVIDDEPEEANNDAFAEELLEEVFEANDVVDDGIDDVEPEMDDRLEAEDEVYLEAGTDGSIEEYGSGDDSLDFENTRANDYSKTDETEMESIESKTVFDDAEAGQSLATPQADDSEISHPLVQVEPETGLRLLEQYTIAVVSTVIASFFAVAAYTYRLKRNLRVVDVNQRSNKKTLSYSQTWQEEAKAENDVLNDEPCQSEMSSSSFRHSSASSYSNKDKTMRKKLYSKRESLSDSPPSLSYGSFTTFERIPIKNNGNGGEDEVITPVRRSSRIRSHQQLPSP